MPMSQDKAKEAKPPGKDDSAPAKTESPRVQIDQLKRELSTATAKAKKEYGAAKTKEEKDAIVKAYEANRKDLLDKMPKRLWEIANANRKNPEIVEALRLILLSNDKELRKLALQRIKDDHWSTADIDRLLPSFGEMQNGEELLKDIVANSKRAEAVAIAKFILATGKLSRLNEEDKKARDELIRELEGIAKTSGQAKFGDLTLKQKIEEELFELKNLMIGCTAPDISGVDADGKAFKLSDYRGKVVVVDFWASW